MLGVSLVINFTVDYPIRFNTWNGRFLSRLVEESLEVYGYRVQHNARFKPFTITPILNDEDEVVSILKPHVPYWFRVSLFCRETNCQGVVDALTKREFKLSTGEVITINKVDVTNHRFESKTDNSNDAVVIHWRVRFWPTSFIFRSHYVTWPSPARFLASAGQTLARVLKGSELVLGRGGDSLVGVVNDVYLKDFVKELVFNTEVVDFRVRRFAVDLGRGRKMPVFSGVAQYVTYTERPSLFRLLLDVANAYGVGKNRALGFGYVVAEVVGERSISRR